MTATKELNVPAWIFEHTGEYFLIGVEPSGRVRIDGGHSDPQGVAKAKRLHESIGIVKPPAGTRFIMVKIEEVPQLEGQVNQDAIDLLNTHLRSR